LLNRSGMVRSTFADGGVVPEPAGGAIPMLTHAVDVSSMLTTEIRVMCNELEQLM